MERVVDPVLIAQLEAFFLHARNGKLVRGVEKMERAWYANNEVGAYQACVNLYGRITPIFAVPYTVIPRR